MDVRDKCQSKGFTWVGGEGPAHAKIAIVGEAPGVEENLRGKPFCGAAGFLLDSVLGGAGIFRDQVYVTNVVKVRPPNNEISRLGELGLAVSEFTPALREELAAVRPNVVVALGALALEILAGEKGIMKWRGSIVKSSLVSGLKVIPSVHPAAILRQYKWRPLLQLDMKKVKRESESPLLNLPERELMIEPKFVEVQDIVSNIKKNYDRVAFDIEVDRQGMMSCISLSPSPKWAISIPFRNGYNSYWHEGEELQIYRWLHELFNSEIKLIAQNALFDLMWLVPRLGYIDMYMDTMWAHQVCYAEIPKGLDILASIYTNEPYYKEERKVWKDTSITRQLWSYNAKDAVVTLEVALRLEEELRNLKLESFFFGFVMRLLPVLLQMQMRGMKIDIQVREQVREQLLNRKKELENAFGSKVNLQSPKQLAELLYEEMGLPKQYHHKTGALTTNKDALVKLRRKMR